MWWRRPSIEELRRSLQHHEELARDYSDAASLQLRLKNYERHVQELALQRWYERKAAKLREKIKAMETRSWIALKSERSSRNPS